MSSASADQRAAAEQEQEQQPPSSRTTATTFANAVFYAMHFNAVHRETLFPLPLAIMTGWPLFTHPSSYSYSASRSEALQEKVEALVFGSWQFLLKNQLVTKDEIVTAVMEKKIKALFTSKVRQFANDDPCVGSPRWRSVPICKNLAQSSTLIEGLHFDTDYDNSIDMTTHADWIEFAGMPIVGARHYAACMKGFKENVIDVMIQLKDDGNKLFGQGKFKQALKKYKEAISILVVDIRMWPVPVSQYDFVSVLYANCAQCFLNLKDFKQAAQNAKIALAFNPDNEKAKFRLQAAATGLLAPLSSGGGGEAPAAQASAEKPAEPAKAEEDD